MIFRLTTLLAGMAMLWPATNVHSQASPSAPDDDGGYYMTEPLHVEHFDENGNEIRGAIGDLGWVTVLGFELRGRTGPFEYRTGENTAALWCTGGSERFADARLDLPHNAELTFFRMWGFDNSDDHDLTAFLRESCLPNVAAGEPVETNLAEISSSGAPGTFSTVINLQPAAPITNTRTCNYYVRVRFAPNCADGGQLTVRKFRVQYELNP